MPSPETDLSAAVAQAVVARAQRGEAPAMGQLYDQHHPAIFTYRWARLGDRAAAADLTGEVFLRMVTALPGYQQQTLPFRAWLYRIAQNLLIDYWRRADARPQLPLESAVEHGAPEADVPALVEQRLTMSQLHHALARLDDAQREVMTLRFLTSLSILETAAALEKTEAAVKALQHRGLAALRHTLADGGATP